METGKFLGYMVSEGGIEANLEKVEAVMEMPSSRNLHEVQRLARQVVALNRFIV